MLEVIRHEQGDIPLNIVSGYRTQAYNDNLYKTTGTTSMHILAAAADIKSKIGYHKLGVICKKLYDDGVIGGLGLGYNMLHVDIRHLIPYKTRKNMWFYKDRNGVKYKNYNDWYNKT